jgi:4-diphosphocytidyl-2-C-methyl-D-erythritol kinase
MGVSSHSHRFLAPAKLNIRLKVTGRRADGYHELVSIMVPVGLFDHIELELIRLRRITLFCHGFSVPNYKENLAYRAASAFFSKAGTPPGISIKLTKNIPVSAGLGGGSSDAAFILKGLNEMWSNPLTPQELADLAVFLGADVPFFLLNRPCIARGIGEILEPIEKWPKFYVNLKLELTKGEYTYILDWLKRGRFEISRILENDLETVTGFHFPIIARIKKLLLDEGAEGALMSGSGPSVFGIFKSKDRALIAKKNLLSKDLGEIFVVEGLT